MEHGPGWFSSHGTDRSAGTKLLSVSGDCKRPGIYEVSLSTSLTEILELVGAEDAQALQVGGPSGQMVGPEEFNKTICYDDFPTGGSMMVFGPQRKLLEVVLAFLEFFVEESCGYCTPCRVGNVLLEQGIRKILDGKGEPADLEYLEELAQTVKMGSRCGLGQTSPNPVLSTLQRFRGEYERLVKPAPEGRQPGFDLSEAVASAASIVGRESTHS
jgi:[NiFe] hydrogenase diaphorase moiety large subunit